MAARCFAASLLLVLLLVLATATATASPLELSTEFFLVPERPVAAPAPPPAPAPAPPGVVVATRGGGGGGGGGGGAVLRREPWVVPLLVVAALCMAVMAGFEVLVLCKARRASPPASRRHLFLGQMLLLGLFLCAAVGAAGAAQPSPATCGALRLGAGVASALVFAALLVKCVFLISLNAGVYLPAPYQALLLLFAVLIQVAVGLQWLLHAPPQVRYLPSPPPPPPPRRLVVSAEDLLSPASPPPQPLCRAPFADLLLSLVYVAALIALVALLAVKSRGIRDNYREATFIGLSVGCVVPIWVLWVLGAFTVAERHRDACLAFGLVATAAVVFLVMFMPKGRQLAAMGREGVYAEDREERCSTLSRAGSGYSPSFYHFKPIKCGGGGAGLLPPGLLPPGLPAPAPTPAPPTHLGLHHHHHPHKAPPAPAPAHADRVTLVAAPSYTRMYHYYPYCYYPGGVYVKPDDGNVYTTLEPTLSSNPNVFFQRSGVHPGMMY